MDNIKLDDIKLEKMIKIASELAAEAIKRIKEEQDDIAYDSLHYHLTQFITGLEDDLSK